MGEPEGVDADADSPAEGDSRRVCEFCGRKFNPASYERHHAVCQQVFRSKRPQFDALKHGCSSGGSLRLPPPGRRRAKPAGPPDGAAVATAPLQPAQAVAAPPAPAGAAATLRLDPDVACAESFRRGGPDAAGAAAGSVSSPVGPLAEEVPTRPPTSPPLAGGAPADQAVGFSFEDAHDSSRSWADEDLPPDARLPSVAAAATAGRRPGDARDSLHSWGEEDLPPPDARLAPAAAAAAAGRRPGDARESLHSWGEEDLPPDALRPPAAAAAAAGRRPGDARDSLHSWGEEDLLPPDARLAPAAAAASAGRRPGDARDSLHSWGEEDLPPDARLPSAVAAAAAGYTRLPVEHCAEDPRDGSRSLGEEDPPLDSRFPSAVAAAAAGYTRLPLPAEGPAEPSLAADVAEVEAAAPPPRLDDVPLRGGAAAGLAALALESDEELPEQDLQVCEYCSRRFKPASLEKHRAVCASVFGGKGFRRGPFESQPKRLGKLRVGIAPAGAPQDGCAPLELSSTAASSTAASSSGAPSRSRGCNRTGSLSRPAVEKALQLCPHCGRSFHSAAFEKHTGVCQRIFAVKADKQPRQPKSRAGRDARQPGSSRPGSPSREQRFRPPPPVKTSPATSAGLQGRSSSVTSLVRQPAPKQLEGATSMFRSSSIPRAPPSPAPPPPLGDGESGAAEPGAAARGAGRAGGDGQPRLADVAAAPSAAAPSLGAASPPDCAHRASGDAPAAAPATCPPPPAAVPCSRGGGPPPCAGRAPDAALTLEVAAAAPAAAPCPSPSPSDLAALCKDRRGLLERARLGHKLGQRPASTPSVDGLGQSSRLAWPAQ